MGEMEKEGSALDEIVLVLAPGQTIVIHWQRRDFQPTESEALRLPPSQRGAH